MLYKHAQYIISFFQRYVLNEIYAILTKVSKGDTIQLTVFKTLTEVNIKKLRHFFY